MVLLEGQRYVVPSTRQLGRGWEWLAYAVPLAVAVHGVSEIMSNDSDTHQEHPPYLPGMREQVYGMVAEG